MKKSLIALAVASVVSAPAFAATANVDVYGVMSFAVEDGSKTATLDANGNQTNQDTEVVDRVSRIGFKGSEDLGGGLKAIWQIEQQINATGNGSFGGANLRNTYVGLAGGFGTVLMGRHDTPYKTATGKLDPFADTLADYNSGGVLGLGYINGAQDYRSPQTVVYMTPNFSGLSFAAAAIAGSNSQVDKTTNPDNVDGWSAALSYDNGPLFASLAYQKLDRAGQMAASPLFTTTTTTAPGAVFNVNLNPGSSKAMKAGIGYAFGNLKLGALYEKTSTDATLTVTGPNPAPTLQESLTGDVDTRTYGVNAVFQMGAIALKGAYMRMNLEQDEAEIDADADRWTVGADYSLSKRTVAYAAYTSDDRDDLDDKVTKYGIGVKHSF